MIRRFLFAALLLTLALPAQAQPAPVQPRERTRTRTRSAEPPQPSVHVDEAPLEDVVTVAAPQPVVLAPTTSPALARPRTATIDPFE